jgi:hypothetical protein
MRYELKVRWPCECTIEYFSDRKGYFIQHKPYCFHNTGEWDVKAEGPVGTPYSYIESDSVVLQLDFIDEGEEVQTFKLTNDRFDTLRLPNLDESLVDK